MKRYEDLELRHIDGSKRVDRSVEDTLPPLGVNPLKATESEMIPHNMVRNSSGMLINFGFKVVQISQAEIQPRIEHLTRHKLIGKFSGIRLDMLLKIAG